MLLFEDQLLHVARELERNAGPQLEREDRELLASVITELISGHFSRARGAELNVKLAELHAKVALARAAI